MIVKTDCETDGSFYSTNNIIALADEMMIFRIKTIFNVIQYSSASLNMNTFYMLLKEFLSQCKMQVLNAMLDI